MSLRVLRLVFAFALLLIATFGHTFFEVLDINFSGELGIVSRPGLAPPDGVLYGLFALRSDDGYR